MRITIDGRRVDLSTQKDCEPNRWNARAGQATGTKEEIKILNSYLNSLQTRIYEVHRTLIDKNEPVTVANIKNHLRGNTERARMVLEVFQHHNQHHNDQLKQLVGKEYAPGTLTRYRTSLEHTRSFIAWKYGVATFDWREIDRQIQ